MTLLVIDVGTSGLRAALVDDGSPFAVHHTAFPPSTPFPGLVEFDAAAMGAAVLHACDAVLREAGAGVTIAGVGITAQRASTVVWDRTTGVPVGPAIGWQDLRTVFDCITLASEHGLRLAPNQSATKLAALLNTHDPGRERDLCFGTVDTWVAWVLSQGAVHATDRSNAAVTGLALPDASAWSEHVLDVLRIPHTMLPGLIDTTGTFGTATALAGSPPLAALVGDQQASLIGQSCVLPGVAKITFGTGGMLDAVTGAPAPTSARRSAHGTYPIAAWSRAGEVTWGLEAIILSAGSNVDWLRDDLGLIDSSAHSHEIAAQCDTSDGVVFVPAQMGLGTPQWDYGARGTLLGLTRGTGRAEVVRAVLEGVAQRGADLLDAARADSATPIDSLRIDGGMSANPTFVQALADATGVPIEVSSHVEATTVGAAYLAGMAVGVWSGFDDVAAAWHPRAIVEPGTRLDRRQWAEALRRAGGWMPDLSALDF